MSHVEQQVEQPVEQHVEQHAEQNVAMFSRIAGTYDLANDVLSLGHHRSWRAALLAAVDVKAGERALDVATGTGEVALALAARGADVVGVDPCEPMLEVARAKHSNVSFVVGDAMALEFGDAAFDVVTISWGIRNVADPQRGLNEFARVLKPGGRLAVLEFGQPSGVVGAAYDLYGKHVLPRLGGLVSGDGAAYAYLNRSSSRFPCGDAFLSMLRTAGFVDVDARRFFGGLAWLYTARR